MLLQLYAVTSDTATGGMGANAPSFCQDDARDFFKSIEKELEGVVANLQRSRGRGKYLY